MAKKLHTPGPWRAEKGPIRWNIVAPNREVFPEGVLARVKAITVGAASSKAYAKVKAEQEANARLIAAAPDLLSALKSALFNAYVENPEANGDEYPEWVARAEVAVAKAEGRKGHK